MHVAVEHVRHAGAVVLLGGLWDGTQARREACLRQPTGILDERVHAIVARNGSTPETVSAILEAAVESVAGTEMDDRLAGELCIADRRFLMLQIARQSAGDVFWISPACRYCRERFDVELSRSVLPTKPAGPTFPFADVVVRGAPVRARVPNGSDQVRIAGLDEHAATAVLLRRCVTTVGGSPPPDAFFERLTDEDVAAVEAALDDVAPDVGTVRNVVCPSCSRPQVVEFDPYQFTIIGSDGLFLEVHTIASRYHWAEASILSLSRERRHRYLGLIERSLGQHS